MGFFYALKRAPAARSCETAAAPAGLASQYNPVFPRKKWLPRSLFQTVLTNGRRLSSENFSIVFSDSAQGLPAGRYGFSVSIPKKVARLSVTRHRIKRQVSAALQALPLPKALIVFPRASVHSVSYQDMKSELTRLLSKIND